MNRLERNNKIKTLNDFIRKQEKITNSLKAYYEIKKLLRLLGENDFSAKLGNRLDNISTIFHSLHKELIDELMKKEKEDLNIFIEKI